MPHIKPVTMRYTLKINTYAAIAPRENKMRHQVVVEKNKKTLIVNSSDDFSECTFIVYSTANDFAEHL